MSKKNELQKAIDCLQIQDVFLVSSTSSLLIDGFEPKYNSGLEEIGVQFKHLVAKHQVFEIENGDEKEKIFRVYIELGARWVLPGEQDGEPEICALIEGLMVSEYYMSDNPGEDALREFALKNASFHVWPYWREYLMSQASKMNLPKTVLPAIQFATN